MALRILPSAKIDDMVLGEDCSYNLDLNNELDGNTVVSHTYKVYNSSGVEVTGNFSGGSSSESGIITFGLIAYSAGSYKLRFWVTCNEILPDLTTLVQFTAALTVRIKSY